LSTIAVVCGLAFLSRAGHHLIAGLGALGSAIQLER
jgi:hypothetical protein